ncbi:lipocalin [Paraburkholderia dipogonis]|uniref:Outer membrane lipoprotein Blc n=1 Tax=Paraburkholderia dipogonis TaxID=1211383 RepID=A0A4Y8MR58_9BURK|nr:lipocalin family protein [Paraburkholderia dipogonis]TFE39899.1 lipocalin [Paraburkholderia dipogonis]
MRRVVHAIATAAATAVASVLLLSLAACSNDPPNPNPRASEPLSTVPVDLPRYMGRWYIIANIPYFAERDMVASRAEWTLRQDGKIDDSYYARKKRFDSEEKHYQFLDTPVPGKDGGEWSVQLFWPIHVTQLTLYVDSDYRYTILGYPGKNLGWIFSREPDMSDDTYRALLARLDAMGYDTSRFRRVPQRPDQLGKPGFASPGDKD